MSDVSTLYFSTAFDQATKRAKGIHFNLEGIRGDPILFAETRGSKGKFAPGARFAADELYIIKNDKNLCWNKTKFYRLVGGEYKESEPDRQRICAGCAGGH